MKNFLTILILAFLSLNVTGCFSIGARSRMEGRHIKTYPGVDAYSGFVTGAFKQMDTSDAIFFGILISPHLAAATLDLPLTFIVDSVMYSSDKKKVYDWEKRPDEVFKNDWPKLMDSIKETKLEEALKLIDKLGFARFMQLLEKRPQKEKILFCLLKVIDESQNSSSEQFAVNVLRKFPTQDVLKVMEESWWPHLIVSESKRGRSIIRSAYLDGKMAAYAIDISNSDSKSSWDIKYWPRMAFIMEYPVNNTSTYLLAVKNPHWKSYKLEEFYGKPASLKLPVFRLSKAELHAWKYGGPVSKWAEKYFPLEVIEHFEFGENKFGIPELIEE